MCAYACLLACLTCGHIYTLNFKRAHLDISQTLLRWSRLQPAVGEGLLPQDAQHRHEGNPEQRRHNTRMATADHDRQWVGGSQTVQITHSN